ncbi:MAG: aminopeptidase [Candidatus Dormibacteria bacterium]
MAERIATDVRAGAANAVRVCLAVEPRDVVGIVGDRATGSIVEALAEECEGAGAAVHTWWLEDFGPRPLREYPVALRENIERLRPTVSFLAAGGQLGELAFRMPYLRHLVYEMKARHGHMIGITERLMREGMAADYREVARLTSVVNDAVKGAREIEVTTPSGTDLRARFDPSRLRWHPCPGLYHSPGTWGNLPEGETFTCPSTVDGVVGAEVLGDHFSEAHGVLPQPVRFEISEGRCRRVTAHDPVLQSELDTYLAQHENSNRVGEFAIGTNLALGGLSGNLLQDEKLPGVHVAFGNPYGEETGADWNCPSHIDVVATRSTIRVDGQYLMRDGVFTV